jgi:hypothetical protein
MIVDSLLPGAAQIHFEQMLLLTVHYSPCSIFSAGEMLFRKTSIRQTRRINDFMLV